MLKQIIVMGGGWFAKGNSEAKIEKYILEQAQKDKPKVCFLPQASCESREYIVKFFEVFTELGAEPSWVSLFGRVTDAWKQHLLNQDIIYVGGGNTKSMLALWKAWGVDQVLREAYEKGIIYSREILSVDDAAPFPDQRTFDLRIDECPGEPRLNHS